MVALELLIVHTPPGAALVYVTGEPIHTVVGPAIAPASGRAITVTVFTADNTPQVPVTV